MYHEILTISAAFKPLNLLDVNYFSAWTAYEMQWPAGTTISIEKLQNAFLENHKNILMSYKKYQFKGYKGEWLEFDQTTYDNGLLPPFNDQEDLSHGEKCPQHAEHAQALLNLFYKIVNEALDGKPTQFYFYDSDLGRELCTEVDGGFCMLLINENSCKAILVFADSVAG